MSARYTSAARLAYCAFRRVLDAPPMTGMEVVVACGDPETFRSSPDTKTPTTLVSTTNSASETIT